MTLISKLTTNSTTCKNDDAPTWSWRQQIIDTLNCFIEWIFSKGFAMCHTSAEVILQQKQAIAQNLRRNDEQTVDLESMSELREVFWQRILQKMTWEKMLPQATIPIIKCVYQEGWFAVWVSFMIQARTLDLQEHERPANKKDVWWLPDFTACNLYPAAVWWCDKDENNHSLDSLNCELKLA